jgi:gliding motility-associated-like protein
MKFLLTSALILLVQLVLAQTCTTTGQTPSSAFPVCGTSTFSQTNVPICGGRRLPAQRCPGEPLADKNPFWYKFTCYQAGTLGFEITPNNLNDDYDWELYDVTNVDPNDVFTNGNLVVSCNWSGSSGKTGASSAGSQLFVCAGAGKPLYSSRANLEAGHNYLLLISHFTNSQSGYSLAFGGGSAVITDTTVPAMKTVAASCGGDVLRLKLNKRIKCNSISSNGSEFTITPAVATVVNTVGFDCSTQFDTDSLNLQLSQFLPPGNYTLQMKKGADANTLLDFCDHAVPENSSVAFTILPKAPTPLDSIAPVQCAPLQVRLVFKRAILCSSFSNNASEFTINGTYPVAVVSASGNCVNGSTREILLSFDKALQKAGSFTLTLQRGADGNTLIDECGEETPAGSTIGFSVKDTVNPDFSYAINYGCTTDTVQYIHAGGNGVNSWHWNLDEGQTSTQQNAVGYYKAFNKKTVSLAVSNGFCVDSSMQEVQLINFLKPDFTAYEDNCPNEPVVFTNVSQGLITQYTWSFGDGGTAVVQSPTHVYVPPSRVTAFSVRLAVTDSFGCRSTVQKNINVYSNCFLAVPNAFTPNADGLNDLFHPLNAIKAEQLDFRVFNRWGQQIFSSTNWKEGWNGKVNGVVQAAGTYIWTLRYVHRETKKLNEDKGIVILIR